MLKENAKFHQENIKLLIMYRKAILFIITTGFFIFSSCKQQGAEQTDQQTIVSVKTVKIKQGNIEDHIQLNGKTIYQKKNKILSPIAGYVIHVNINRGDRVKKNDVLFEIETKENRALRSTGSSNQGIIKVRALSDGIIDELNVFETGVYVLDGDFLCNIVESNDFMVQVNVPFEYNSLLNNDLKCKIILSDHSVFDGNLYKILPTVNEADQTQVIWIKPVQNLLQNRIIPENLNLLVDFVWNKKNKTLLIPKNALMTNETQSDFWVMKISDDDLAVKILVQKGIENDSIVEIISNQIKKGDLVISQGAYGLPDSTHVKIEK